MSESVKKALLSTQYPSYEAMSSALISTTAEMVHMPGEAEAAEWSGHHGMEMHTGSRPKEWNATGDLGTNHSVPAHTKRGAKTSVGQALGAASTLVKTPPPITERMTPAPITPCMPNQAVG